MTKKEPLDKKIIGTRCQCGFSRTATNDMEDVKFSLSNLKKRLKETLQEVFNEWEINENVIDYVFKELDKDFIKELGEGLVE